MKHLRGRGKTQAGKKSSGLFRASKMNSTVTTACAITVAMAAPVVSRRGMGPRPKMKSGSRIMFRIRPTALMRNGVVLSPEPFKMAVK